MACTPTLKYSVAMLEKGAGLPPSRTILGYRANLVGAVNAATDGATVEIDISVARWLVSLLTTLGHAQDQKEETEK